MTSCTTDASVRSGGSCWGFERSGWQKSSGKLAEYKLPYTEVFLERLDRQGVMEAVQGPAQSTRLKNHYHLTVEPGLPSQIADDLLTDAGSAVAPTLQILLSRMWESAVAENSNAPVFSRELYNSLRREGVLLRHFLEQQLHAVETNHRGQVPPDLLLDVLSLHTTSLGTAAHQPVDQLSKTYAHHDKILPTILSSCKDAYLLTIHDESGQRSRLAHDTLAPLIREKYEMSDHPGQRARRILENRAKLWKEGKEGPTLDEQDLSVVEAGKDGMRDWNEEEIRLVDASRRRRRRRLIARRSLQSTALLAIVAIVACLGSR